VKVQPPPAFSQAGFSVRELGSGQSLFPAAIFVPVQGFRLPLVFCRLSVEFSCGDFLNMFISCSMKYL
jgi:hypothetical protein